uniref:Uncharacterized protein n=1 Tax=Alexandrium monilatum TaxID=311494 RepID=A0A7S4QGK9_9DINO
MAQEHQEYISSKINPILESLVTQVLLERPDNPVPFMVKLLAKQTKQGEKTSLEQLGQVGVGEADRLRSEVKSLQDEVRELEAKLDAARGVAPQAEKPEAAAAAVEA